MTTSFIPKGSREDRLGGRARHRDRHQGAICRARTTPLKHIAGYCVVNDVSEREFQIERGGQWTKGKSADTFGPIGPWLVTADEVPDPQALGLWTEVNGKRMQNSNTSDMIFGIAQIVSYVSHFMTLHAGRRHPDRHALRRRSRHEAAAIPQARRHACACRSRAWASSSQRVVALRVDRRTVATRGAASG